MDRLRKLLIIDDDADLLIAMRMQLRGLYGVSTATSIAEGLCILEEQDADLILLDVGLDGEDGLEGIQKIRAVNPSLCVAMLSGCKDVRTVVAAIRAGAVDYLTKPVDLDELAAVVEKAVAARAVLERCDALLNSHPVAINGKTSIICRSTKMKQMMAEADAIRGHRANVLIVGETGTGKELLARYINDSNSGKKWPFVAVNCAAIPEHLLESELFGHESGSFTGANRRRVGKFELADGGDIFLDEISTMKLSLQVKLLRVIQEKEFCRLGSNEHIQTDFRVISASNQPLDALVENGEFRSDLYHRLRVIQLVVPPLRERVEDIPLLIDHYVSLYARDGKKKRVTQAAMGRLMQYNWPGNVRELANVIQSLVILTPGDEIDVSSFPPWVMNGCCYHGPQAKVGLANSMKDLETGDGDCTLKDYVNSAERRYIERILVMHENDKSKTARYLGIGRTTLYQRLKELGLMK